MRSGAVQIGYEYQSRTQELAVKCRQAALARKQRNRKVRFFSLLAACIVFGIMIGFFSASTVKLTAAASHETQMLYRSVYVQEGDSLSSLEQTYNTESTMSRNAYIRLVKTMNHINDNNTIHAGGYITVPYYEVRD